MNEPLIWTSKGNLPLASLTYQTAWDDQPTYIKFCERYLDSTGEIVKESAHVYDKRGLTTEAIAASFGS
jgi:hypothetical protein